MCALFQSKDEIRWLTEGITQDRTPGLRSYLMKELDIEEVDSARKCSLSKSVGTISCPFRRMTSGSYSFYKFLYLDKKTSVAMSMECSPKLCPSCVFRTGTHVAPFQNDANSPNAYLSVETDTETSLPIVKVNASRQDEEVQKVSEGVRYSRIRYCCRSD